MPLHTMLAWLSDQFVLALLLPIGIAGQLHRELTTAAGGHLGDAGSHRSAVDIDLAGATAASQAARRDAEASVLRRGQPVAAAAHG